MVQGFHTGISEIHEGPTPTCKDKHKHNFDSYYIQKYSI